MGFGLKNIQSGIKAASKVGAKNSNFQPPFHSDDNNSYAKAALQVVDKIRSIGKVNPAKEVDSAMPTDYFPDKKDNA